MKWINLLVLVGATSIGFTPIALSLPSAKRQGDYLPSRQLATQIYWQVVDSDPSGLNCRLAKQFQGFTSADLNAPEDLFRNNQPNIGAWSVITTFPPRTLLNAQTGHRGANLLLDDQDKPWLAVSVKQGTQYANCFVRANSRFIQPL